MYVLDWKLSKYLIRDRDELYNYYVSYLSSFTEVKLSKSKLDKILKSMSCFVLNMNKTLCYSKETIIIPLDSVLYSRKLIYNGVDVKRKIPYKAHRAMLSWLHLEGYIVLDVGGVLSFKLGTRGKMVVDETTCSTITITSKLMSLFKDPPDRELLGTERSVLVLRNKDKKEVCFSMTQEMRLLVTMMDKYNVLARGSTITLDGYGEFDVQGVKIYNNSSFTEGGRVFLVGGDSVQSLNSTLRSHIKINGESVVELDFSSLHPSLCAEQDGHHLPKEFDPYGIDIEGYDPVVLRKLSKVALLIMINIQAPTEKLAVHRAGLAISQEISTMKDTNGDRLHHQWFRDSKIPSKVIDTKEIMSELYDQNYYMYEHFYSGSGIKLQNLDSRIVDYVLNYFTQIGEVVIPIHDSFIIRASLKKELNEVMVDGYRQVMGTTINCKIKEN